MRSQSIITISGSDNYVARENQPELYDLTGADPPIWEPDASDILDMFSRLENGETLTLHWRCPGRLPPCRDSPEMSPPTPLDEKEDLVISDVKGEMEPSAFEFDDSGNGEVMKITPRTPVSARVKQPERKMARMDNVLNSIKRQQKLEREERRSQWRPLGGSHNAPSRSPTAHRVAQSPGVAQQSSSPCSTTGDAPHSPQPFLANLQPRADNRRPVPKLMASAPCPMSGLTETPTPTGNGAPGKLGSQPAYPEVRTAVVRPESNATAESCGTSAVEDGSQVVTWSDRA